MDIPEDILLKSTKWKRRGYDPHAFFLDTEDYSQWFVVRRLTKAEFTSCLEECSPGVYFFGHEDLAKSLPEGLADLTTINLQDIISTGLLYPDLSPVSLDETTPAGVDIILANKIMEVSGWSSPEEIEPELQEARDYLCTLQGFMEARIKKALPSIKQESLDDLTFPEFMKMLALSEALSGIELDLRPWLHPEDYQREIDREQKRNDRALSRERDTIIQQLQKTRDPDTRRQLYDRYKQLLSQAGPGGDPRRSIGDQPNFDHDNMMLMSI